MKTIVFTLALFFALPAFAQVKTNDMVRYCKASERISSFIDANGDVSHFSSEEWLSDGICSGFFNGFMGGEQGLSYVADGEVFEIEITDGVTVSQAIRLFLTYTSTHPDSTSKPLIEVVISSLVAGGVITSKSIGSLTPSNKKPTSFPSDGRQITQVLQIKVKP
jgi:hypothetical protein